jgi:hypothetical protein
MRLDEISHSFHLWNERKGLMRLGSSKSCNMACHNNYTAMLIELANEFLLVLRLFVQYKPMIVFTYSHRETWNSHPNSPLSHRFTRNNLAGRGLQSFHLTTPVTSYKLPVSSQQTSRGVPDSRQHQEQHARYPSVPLNDRRQFYQSCLVYVIHPRGGLYRSLANV